MYEDEAINKQSYHNLARALMIQQTSNNYLWYDLELNLVYYASYIGIGLRQVRMVPDLNSAQVVGTRSR